MRTRGMIPFVFLLLLGVCAAPASAEPLSMTFTEDRANVGVQLTDAALFEPPDTAPFEAQIDGSGAITAGHLTVPRFSTRITEPIEADVTVDFEIGTITGQFTAVTGALTLQGEAGGTLTAQSGTYEGEECIVSIPETLELSTDGNTGGASPRFGSPFHSGLAGPGSIAGRWTDMEATPVDSGDSENVSFCNNVEDRIGGQGGIWLDQKGTVIHPPLPDSPPPPPAAACVVPKLTGLKLKAAKRKLKAANCTVGKVSKPKGLKAKGLVVKSSNPAQGTTKPVNAKVRLRLGPKS
jgi:hypothetical protein